MEHHERKRINARLWNQTNKKWSEDEHQRRAQAGLAYEATQYDMYRERQRVAAREHSKNRATKHRQEHEAKRSGKGSSSSSAAIKNARLEYRLCADEANRTLPPAISGPISRSLSRTLPALRDGRIVDRSSVGQPKANGHFLGLLQTLFAVLAYIRSNVRIIKENKDMDTAYTAILQHYTDEAIVSIMIVT